MGPFKNFAKLFATSRGQVLALVQENDDEAPCLNVSCLLDGGLTVGIQIGGWNNNDAGWAQADKALVMFDDTAAENFATKIVPKYEGLTA